MVLGNTSGFTRIKGQEYLLKAVNKIFKKTGNVFLLLVGGKGQREPVSDLLEPQFRNRLILPGYRTDIPLLLSIMDIFAFPSTTEGCSLSLIEAMLMTKPILVSDIPSFREVITDGINGIFFKNKDPEDLADRLFFLIHNKDLREKLGENARSSALNKFTLYKMLDQTAALYEKLIHRRPLADE